MNIRYIREYLNNNIGINVVIYYNGMRNKNYIYKGYIEKVYDRVFTIRLDNNTIKCFSYADILSKRIKVKL